MVTMVSRGAEEEEEFEASEEATDKAAMGEGHAYLLLMLRPYAMRPLS